MRRDNMLLLACNAERGNHVSGVNQGDLHTGVASVPVPCMSASRDYAASLLPW